MKWLNIILVISAFLIIINVYFIVLLNIQYNNKYKIDKDIIKTTIGLLAEDSIIVDGDLIPKMKNNYNIYEGEKIQNIEEYYINTALLISPGYVTNDFSLHMINNGIKILNDSNGDIFNFLGNNMFSLEYFKNGDTDLLKYNEISKEQFIGVNEVSKENNYKKYEDYLNNWFFHSENGLGYKNTANYLKIKIEKVYAETTKQNINVYAFDIIQQFAGIDIIGTKSLVVFYDTIPVYFNGAVLCSLFKSDYNTENFDQINVLFSEKSYIKEQNEISGYNTIIDENGNSDDNSVSDSVTTENEFDITDTFDEENIEETEETDKQAELQNNDQNIHILSKLKPVFCINWNDTIDTYYLIPAWYIEYESGIVRIRNAINGNLYTL